MSSLRVSVVLLAIGWMGSAAMAATVYEGFNEGAGGQLLGNGGGTGFSGDWAAGGFNATIHTNYQVAAESLTYGQLQTSGGRATSAAVGGLAGLVRPLSSPLGAAGTTSYMSFLYRPESLLNDQWSGLYIQGAGNADDVFIGKPGAGSTNELVIEDRGGTGQVSSGVGLVLNTTYLIVLKMQFAAGLDTFTLYVNPDLSAEPLTGDAVKLRDISAVNNLVLYSSGAFSLDEIRIGDTYADVTPTVAAVPTPTILSGAAVLMACCGAMNLRRRRTMRN